METFSTLSSSPQDTLPPPEPPRPPEQAFDPSASKGKFMPQRPLLGIGLSRILAVLTISLALSNLWGRGFNLPWLHSFGVAHIGTKVNTALLLILAGVELWWLAGNRQRVIWLGKLLPMLILAFCGLTLAEYAFSVDLGLDRFLRNPGYTAALLGRPALISALCLGLIGSAFMLMQQARSLMVGQLFALFSTLLVFIALLGHMANLPTFYSFGSLSTLSLPTAICLAMTNLGLLHLSRRQGILQTFLSSHLGGLVVRYLGLYMLIVPALLVVGYSTLITRQWVDPQQGLVLLLCILMIGLFMLFYALASHLNQQDAQRRQHIAQLSENADQIRRQVDLLTGIQNATQTGISALKAVRDQTGTLIDFTVVFRNETSNRLVGRPMEEIIGQRLRSVYPHIVQSGLFDRYVQVVETGEPQQFEQRYMADGVDGWFDVHVCRWGDGIVIDISETSARKRAELALQQQHQLLQAVIDHTEAGMLLAEPIRNEQGQITDFRYKLTNEYNARTVGRPVAELTGAVMGVVFPGWQDTDFFRTFVQVVETGKTERTVFSFDDQGIEGWFDGSFSQVNGCVLYTYLNVTALKEAEQRAQRQATLLANIQNTSQLGIAAYEAVRNETGTLIDFKPVWRNKASVRMTGKPDKEAQETLLTELLPKLKGSELFDRYVAVVETGQPDHFEYVDTLTGQAEHFDITAQPWGDGLVVNILDTTQLRQAERDKLQQAEWLERIQNVSQMGLSAYKAIRNEAGEVVDFQTVFRNEASARMSGQSLEETRRKTLLEWLPSLRTSGTFEQYKHVLDSRQGEQFRYHHQGEGIDGWFEVSVQPWADGLVVSTLETTELRQIEAEKLHQAEQLRGILDAIPSSLFVSEAIRNERGAVVDFTLVEANQIGVSLMGLTVEQVKGRLASELFPHDRDNGIFDRYVAVVNTKQAQQFEESYTLPETGQTVWLDVRLIPLGEHCVIGSSTDITLRKQAELAVQHQAELVEQIMNTTPTSIIVHESVRNQEGEIIDFRMTHLNQTAADLLGNPPDKIQFQRVSRYFDGLLETPLFEQYKAVVRTGQPLRTDVHWQDHWYDFSVARFGDGLIVAAQDVTSIRQYRQELELANYELKRSNESLQSFAYIASHDLQEPLRKITSFADVLHTQYAGQFDAGATDIVRRINESAERMRQLIHDLLLYSRIDTQEEAYKLVDLKKLLLDMQEEELWAALHHNKAELHLDDLPVVLAAPLQMRQLFQNLISNAVKFSVKEVTPIVTVSSRLVSRSDISTGLLPPAKQTGLSAKTFYEIAVTDNGIGFDEKYIDRIFQVFQRLNGRTQYAGSGIGLSICHKIAKRHGGAITATSTPGKGSTFQVYLPKLNQ